MTFSPEYLQELIADPVSVLNRGYRAKDRIAECQERILSWRQIAESITARPDNAPGGSGPGNKTEKCVLSIIELEAEIKDEIMQLAAYESLAAKSIHVFVKDPTYQSVLELRYLSYERWERIAVKLGYTFRWTQELHKRALQALQSCAENYLESLGKKAR